MSPIRKLLIVLMTMQFVGITPLVAGDADVSSPAGEMDPAVDDWSREADGKSDAEILGAIADWLFSKWGEPPIARLPSVTRMPAARMKSIRLGATGADHSSIGFHSLDTLAFYSDRDQTIYLASDWDGRDPADASILVHELVHHVQHVRGLRFDCPQAREQKAFEAQSIWLQEHGLDLEQAFDIDGLTLIVLTHCLH